MGARVAVAAAPQRSFQLEKETSWQRVLGNTTGRAFGLWWCWGCEVVMYGERENHNRSTEDDQSGGNDEIKWQNTKQTMIE